MSIQVFKTAVTASSTTLADLGSGLATGSIRYEPDGRQYMLMKVITATIADGLLFMKDAVTDTEINVIITTGETVPVLGVNNTGTLLAIGAYFWALQRGVGYVDPDASGWDDGGPVGCTSAGEGTAWATAETLVGIAVNDDTATVADNLIVFCLPAGST